MEFFLPVTLEELKSLSDEEVVRRINAKIAPGNDNLAILSFPDFVSAQFYMAELDRREKRRADADRDRIETIRHRINLGIEIFVVVLIGAELIFGIVEGNKQAAVLTQLQSGLDSTANSLSSLKVDTQMMTGLIQRQRGRELDVSVDVTYSPVDKNLVITNTGKSPLSVTSYSLGYAIGKDRVAQRTWRIPGYFPGSK